MERFERDGRLHAALREQGVPHEAVKLVAYGAAGCAIVGTPARVLVFKRGIKAGVPFGSRIKAFEFESVVAVNVRRVADGVVLAVHAPLKVGSCPVYWLDERDDPWHARNAIVADSVLEADNFETAAAELRRLMSIHQARHGRATPSAAPRIASGPHEQARRECASCGTMVVAGWHYCPECGTQFDAPAERVDWRSAGQSARG
jgi:hypothetical protein